MDFCGRQNWKRLAYQQCAHTVANRLLFDKLEVVCSQLGELTFPSMFYNSFNLEGQMCSQDDRHKLARRREWWREGQLQQQTGKQHKLTTNHG